MRGLARQRWTRALGSCFAKSPAAHRCLANFAPIGESYKSVPTNVHHELCSWVSPSEVAYFLDTVVADSSEIVSNDDGINIMAVKASDVSQIVSESFSVDDVFAVEMSDSSQTTRSDDGSDNVLPVNAIDSPKTVRSDNSGNSDVSTTVASEAVRSDAGEAEMSATDSSFMCKKPDYGAGFDAIE